MVTKIISLAPQTRGNWVFQVSVSNSKFIMVIATVIDPSLEQFDRGCWPCVIKFFNASSNNNEIRSFIDSLVEGDEV
jgi:hypothetical protein